MAFENTNEAFGPGLYFRLDDDGDSDTIMILGEPEPRISTYDGEEVVQAMFPIWHEDRVQVWTTSQRTCREIQRHWPDWQNRPLKVTRSGERGSSQTKYTFEPQRQTKLFKDAVESVSASDIEKAMADAMNS